MTQDSIPQNPSIQSHYYDHGYCAALSHDQGGHIDIFLASEDVVFLNGPDVVASVGYYDIDNMIELFKEAKRRIEIFREKGAYCGE